MKALLLMINMPRWLISLSCPSSGWVDLEIGLWEEEEEDICVVGREGGVGKMENIWWWRQGQKFLVLLVSVRGNVCH